MAKHTAQQGIEAMNALIAETNHYKESDFYFSDADYLDLDIEIGTPLLSHDDDFITAYDHYQGWLQMKNPDNDYDEMDFFMQHNLRECTSCEKKFDCDTMEQDSGENYFCQTCYEELAPIMQAEYDEMVAKGEIEE